MRIVDHQDEAEMAVEWFRKELGPFVTAAEYTRMPMVFTDAKADNDPVIYTNDSFVALSGYARAEILGSTLASLLEPDPETAEKLSGEYDRQTHEDIEGRFRRRDGREFLATVFITPVLDADGGVAQHFVSMTDVTENRRMMKALQVSESRFKLAAIAANLGIVDIDFVTGERHWSPELRRMLGIDADAPATEEYYSALIHPADRDMAAKIHAIPAHEEASGGGGTFRINRTSDGKERWIESERHAIYDDSGATTRVLITNRDVTDEHLAQDQIAWAATHDSVTNLPNRVSFRSALEAALREAQGESVVTVLLIDLDRFKQINDLLGHQAGDEVLAEFGARILLAVPHGATLARLGGDEFAVVLPDSDLAAASKIARLILESLIPTMILRDRQIELHASVGISAYPLHGKTSSEIVHCADLALYGAKKEGGGRSRIFASADRIERDRQRQMLRHARTALENNWIEPFYQPQVAFATGVTESFEALLRWRHPRAGLQYPSRISHAFDDPGAASAIGDAMADLALTDLRRWLAAGVAIGRLALNASAVELRDPQYAQNFLSRLDRHGVAPAMLELELTETAFLDGDVKSVTASLLALRDAGIRIALDDFGTGFSSLSHLRDVPVDTIKIDQTFVAGLDHGYRDRAIVKGILSVATDLRIATVAEGVETQVQADFLKQHGCTLGQGFLYSPAMTAQEVRAHYTPGRLASTGYRH